MTEQVRSESTRGRWSPAEADGEDDATRQGGVWHDALQAGPLVLVSFQGIVGNTAFAAFPAAARYLRRQFGESREPLGAPGTVVRAKRSIAQRVQKGNRVWVQIDLDRFEPAGVAAGSDRRRVTERRWRDRPGAAYAVAASFGWPPCYQLQGAVDTSSRLKLCSTSRTPCVTITPSGLDGRCVPGLTNSSRRSLPSLTR